MEWSNTFFLLQLLSFDMEHSCWEKKIINYKLMRNVIGGD